MNEQLQSQGSNYPPVPMTEFLTKDEKELLKRSLLKKFPEDQQEIFLRRCERSKLDPFSGQLHPTVRNTRVRQENGEVAWVPTLVCVTGIYGLLAVAIRTNEYDGTELSWCGKDGLWKPEWLEDENPEAAKAVIYLKHRKPEVMIARWRSFVQELWDKEKKVWTVTDFWDRMPDFMLGKCSRAGALRAAFPDQLSGIYIREELGGELDEGNEDTAKIAENQRREKEVHIPGARVVDSTGPRPAPDQALEPAFDEDKIPPRPSMSEQLKRDFPQAATVSAQQTQVKPPAPAPAPAPVAAAPAQAQEASAQAQPTSAEDNLDMGEGAGEPAAAAQPPPWNDHVIKGITNPRFFQRKLGDLNETERMVLETQWLPKVQEQWDKANEAQKADYPMVQACIAYHKLAKPWQA